MGDAALASLAAVLLGLGYVPVTVRTATLKSGCKALSTRRLPGLRIQCAFSADIAYRVVVVGFATS
jgi:hypothetical protein